MRPVADSTDRFVDGKPVVRDGWENEETYFQVSFFVWSDLQIIMTIFSVCYNFVHGKDEYGN